MHIQTGEPCNINSAKEFYNYTYFKVTYIPRCSVQSRFEQNCYKIIQNLETDLTTPNVTEMQVMMCFRCMAG